MATTTITTPTLPDQQLPQQVVPNPIVAANSNSSWHSSGSIGPFFAVISVLAVLAIISCVLGRICTAQGVTPLESVKHRGWFGWLKGRCSVGGAWVVVMLKLESRWIKQAMMQRLKMVFNILLKSLVFLVLLWKLNWLWHGPLSLQ